MALLAAIKLKQARDYPVAARVLLDPDKQFYEPGDFLQGKVVLSHQQEGLRVKGIKVSLQGSAFAKFKERGQIHDKLSTFLDEGTYVFGGSEFLRGMSRFPPGSYSFPFHLQLPSARERQLPSSFKTAFGVIIYQVLVFLETDLQFLKKGEKTITVHGKAPVPAAVAVGRVPPTPIQFEKVERWSGRPCPKYSFNSPVSNFVAGRSIEFEMRADNCWHKNKTGAVTLVLKTTYHGGQVTRAWKDTHNVVEEVVNHNAGTSWVAELPIPKDVQPSFKGAVIQFRYLLRVSLQLKDGTHIFKFERPVKIGTSGPGDPETRECDREDEDSDSLLDLRLTRTRRSSTSSSLPRYSTLSLRADSFETLPPEYDEIICQTRNGTE